jgi:tight adherence protein C
MYTVLIPILVFASVVMIGGAVLLAGIARRQRIAARLAEFGPLTPEIVDDRERPIILRLLESVGNLLRSKNDAATLSRQLAYAGFFAPAAGSIYMASRALAAAAGVLIAGAIIYPYGMSMFIKVMIAIGCGWVLSLAPSLYVDMRRARRSADIRHHLPDAVDLLEICVNAGIGLDMAWNAVADEIRPVSPVLADEMALANLEMHLGADRSEALRHMAERTRSDDLSSLVGTLVQSERFGTSISDALQTFATSMREARSARASESAEKIGVKMLFPMILFILPSVLIVMGGAAVIKIIDMFGRM